MYQGGGVTVYQGDGVTVYRELVPRVQLAFAKVSLSHVYTDSLCPPPTIRHTPLLHISFNAMPHSGSVNAVAISCSTHIILGLSTVRTMRCLTAAK